MKTDLKMETNRKIATDIVECFEDLLDLKGIEIPCSDELEESVRHDGNNTVKLYGMEYWDLVGNVELILNQTT